MAMPAATPALIERVEPNWAIETVRAAPARASGVSPGPSWPKSSSERSGRCALSRGTAPGALSTATTGRFRSAAWASSAATSGVVPQVLVQVGDQRRR